jgi:hypothetical protein
MLFGLCVYSAAARSTWWAAVPGACAQLFVCLLCLFLSLLPIVCVRVCARLLCLRLSGGEGSGSWILHALPVPATGSVRQPSSREHRQRHHQSVGARDVTGRWLLCA